MEQGQDEAKRPSVFQSISDLLIWLGKAATPLGAFIFAIAAIYWLEFIKVYAIPVSFASSSVLTGLPAMAAAIIAIVGVLTAFVLMPAMLLCIAVDAEGNTMLDSHRVWLRARANLAPGRRTFRDWNLEQRWLVSQCGLGLLWAGVIALGILAKDFNASAVTFTVTIAAMAGCWLLFRPIAREGCGKSTLYFQSLFCAFTGMQFLVVFGVIEVLLQTAKDSTPTTVAYRALSCFFALCILSMAQFRVAQRVAKGWYASAAKHIVIAMIVVSALPAAWPSFGSAIIAYTLRTSADDGKSCVVILASDPSSQKTWSDLVDGSKPGQSIPLAYAVRIDDTYYVKQTMTSPTRSILVSQTHGIESCPDTSSGSHEQRTSQAIKAVVPGAMPAKNDANSLDPALVISGASMLIALCSLMFSVRSWRETNRPLMVARISTYSGGNMGISLNLLLENMGTRPALDVRLHASERDVRAATADVSPAVSVPRDATRVFFSGVFVPVLAGGRTVSNAFGSLGSNGVWKAGATIPITITYRGVGGVRYRESMTLLLSDDEAFAQTFWSKSEG